MKNGKGKKTLLGTNNKKGEENMTPDVSRKVLEDKLAELLKQQEQVIGQVNFLAGAIQITKLYLEGGDKDEKGQGQETQVGVGEAVQGTQ